ncbi:MAG: type II toxin-antitoxin system RelE/ParE family toxin [Acidobacteria bacterium]|nr:type II toxin-antitoxin system RelE/ParE family toxin [Acidobacteriota bacterium]
MDEISRLDKRTAKQVMAKISWLAENANQISPLGLRGNLAGFSKLRIGDYRLIYELNHDDNLVNVHFFGHRSEIYKL